MLAKCWPGVSQRLPQFADLVKYIQKMIDSFIDIFSNVDIMWTKFANFAKNILRLQLILIPESRRLRRIAHCGAIGHCRHEGPKRMALAK